MRDYRGEIRVDEQSLVQIAKEKYLLNQNDIVIFGAPTWDNVKKHLVIKYVGSDYQDPDPSLLEETPIESS